MLSCIVSQIARPCHTDKLMTQMEGGIGNGRLSYARILVEVDASKALKGQIILRNEMGEEIIQKIWYEWKSWQCLTCKSFGHKEGVCVQQRKVVQQWRPKVKSGDEKGTVPTAVTEELPKQQLPAKEALVDPKVVEGAAQATPKSNEVTQGVSILQRTQGSWQRVLQNRLGKEPLVEVDEEMERRFGQALDVIQVLGSLGSWRGDKVIIESQLLPNG